MIMQRALSSTSRISHQSSIHRSLRLAHSRPVRMAAGSYITSSVEAYPEKVKELLSGPGPHYVVFNSDPDPSTGLPWCPDCVRTLPAVRSVIAASPGSLLEVLVGPRAAWKTPTHPLRLDPTLKVTGIPTLLRLDASGGEVARLGRELEAATTPDEAAKLVADFISH